MAENILQVLEQLFNEYQTRKEGERLSDMYNPISSRNSNMDLKNADALHAVYKLNQNMNNAQNSFQGNFFPRTGQGMTGQQGTAGIQQQMLNTYNYPHSSSVYNSAIQPTNYAPMQYAEKPSGAEILRNILMEGGGNAEPSQPDFLKKLVLTALGAGTSGMGIMSFAKMPSFGLGKIAEDIVQKIKQPNIRDEIYGQIYRGGNVSNRFAVPLKSIQKNPISTKRSEYDMIKGFSTDDINAMIKLMQEDFKNKF